MRALTLWQPWASLVALGGKQWETRSWGTNHRGPLLVHAAQAKPPQIDDWRTVEEMLQVLGVSDFDRLPRGGILALVELTGVWCIGKALFPISDRHPELHAVHYDWRRERLFGDWKPGRYMWQLTNVHRLEIPVPATGRQRLWRAPEDLWQRVRTELAQQFPRNAGR